jgi:indolepyruvate ferredoxin oxidoreductase beta subunit
MKSDIIISGVGGQGILSIATVIGISALESNLHLKQAEVHGMSQRGGAVQSHLRISDKEISSDLIPKGEADLILSVEPMESLRYLPYMEPGGWLVTNIQPYINIPDYPSMDLILAEIKKIKNHIAINADQIAHNLGSIKSSNIVILGASCQFLKLPEERLIAGIEKIFSRKGQSVIDLNIKAFLEGKKAGEIYLTR